ncbi:type II toxin-antitoxin system VapC family toxin [Rubrivirga sp.]|uniref:type II toxin-antitoxin system VapC family toxin n=1 Tax=Rubrivirga sp. TaxID=1885344 RepID=UPI003B519D97
MTRYLLDTNTVSEPARRRPDPEVLTRIEVHTGETAIASVVWHELVYGLERMPAGRKRDYVARYLLDVVRPALPVVPFDTAAAEWLARERARLEAQGTPRPALDGMIAAVAARRGLILVTRNTDDVVGYDGLHVENWFSDNDSDG